MDTRQGNFEMAENEAKLADLIEQYSNHGGIFTVGETVELKGSKFRVKSVNPKGLRLRLLPS